MAKRQSAVNRRKVTAPMVELELAALVLKETGIKIEPGKLAQFVRDRFHLLSKLCHEIHELEKAV